MSLGWGGGRWVGGGFGESINEDLMGSMGRPSGGGWGGVAQVGVAGRGLKWEGKSAKII